jgi:ATP-dependent Lon protease
MEIIHLHSYTLEEKLGIARRHLLPRQIERNGLTAKHATIGDKALAALIQGYTREAGVRQLEREIGSALRKIARKVAEKSLKKRYCIGEANLHELLGPIKFLKDERLKSPKTGVVTG